MSSEKEFEAKKFFAMARRTYFEEPLKELGFRKFKSSVIARLTAGDIFQFLDFQKSAYGGQEFTINVGLRPMFCPNEDYLTLLPGNRLGLMATKSKKDKWWNYSTESEGEESFREVSNLVKKFAMPFFDATQTSKDLLLTYEKNIFGRSAFGDRVAWGTVGWQNFDLGHVYLHAGKSNKAIRQFDKCYMEFKKDDRDWAQKAAQRCLLIRGIIGGGQTQIENYLHGTIQSSKEKLKLVEW